MIQTETHVARKTMFIGDEEIEVTVTMDIVVETPTFDSPGGWTLKRWHACDENEDDVEVAECEIERLAGDALSSGRSLKCARPMT